MEPSPFLSRVVEATNAHDVERIVACFTPDYVNETPCHPERGFVGNEQVRRTWTTILGAVPDLVATIVDQSTDGDRVWSEWEMRGTRRDGEPHLMRGVIVFRCEGDQAAGCRFFVEPVVEDGLSADDAVASMTSSSRP